jgi:Xaa-Pro aminopeptidase
MDSLGLDGLLINLPANITYLTGYQSRDSYLLISTKGKVYLTDSRYREEAKNRLGMGFRVAQIENGLLFETIAAACSDLSIKKLGFEEQHISVNFFQRLKEQLNAAAIMVPTLHAVEEFRQVKSVPELLKIREATKITVETLKFAKNLIVPGKKEIEVVGELERFIRYNAGTALSFSIIVASGPNSSFPHHLSSTRKIGKDETVVIDLGVEYQGYKSDLTRVFFSGKIKPLERKVYDIVLKAQAIALHTIKPDVAIRKVDAAARNYIAQRGYGSNFGHSLGHGVGLEVHEAPTICPKSDKILTKGMVFTVEPGIYLPGKFGIRIEDIVTVTHKTVEVISGTLDK